mmetsp:Transcript_49787/g.115567  ORF Transcript_49787/g.115567 Transcript_49787/m.115567 type:complete len:230 (+) Transcript_49787:1877-2566(+)
MGLRDREARFCLAVISRLRPGQWLRAALPTASAFAVGAIGSASTTTLAGGPQCHCTRAHGAAATWHAGAASSSQGSAATGRNCAATPISIRDPTSCRNDDPRACAAGQGGSKSNTSADTVFTQHPGLPCLGLAVRGSKTERTGSLFARGDAALVLSGLLHAGPSDALLPNRQVRAILRAFPIAARSLSELPEATSRSEWLAAEGLTKPRSQIFHFLRLVGGCSVGSRSH